MIKKLIPFAMAAALLMAAGGGLWAEEAALPKGGAAVFDYGVSGAYVTRIIRQTGRSNFVFEDFMPGLFLSVETTRTRPVNYLFRLSAFYPLAFYFNDIPQDPKNVLRYAVDFFAGPLFEPAPGSVFSLNISPGVHVFMQNTDRWNYVHLGLGALLGAEFPIARRWSAILNVSAAFDYGNIGGNRRMEPLDAAYQYQADIGLRYSRKTENPKPYL
ncbi:MAG: hypothetical protein LBR16_09295 [Treponema sp.]|jgi:hypothetical protein|nr:hypothetical protein [Treponema sp.]